MSNNNTDNNTAKLISLVLAYFILPFFVWDWVIWVVSFPIGGILSIWNIQYPFWNIFWVTFPIMYSMAFSLLQEAEAIFRLSI